MNILAIESSCDETAVAIVRNGNEVIVSNIFSQIDVHKLFGGVVPEIAAREHLKIIDNMVHDAFQETNLKISDIEAIAVTRGPGLVGSLLIGMNYAKGLALRHNLPLVPVNHVHAHIHGALLSIKNPVYPSLSLVVSGGHTNLYYLSSPTQFELMAYTMDDACGECFDKVAKLFNLGYPGGPVVEQCAQSGDPKKIKMPRVTGDKTRTLFSYSGLKTYMVNLTRQEGENLSEERRADILASFQDEALGQLIRRLKAALATKTDVKSLVIAGGVAANKRFRSLVDEQLSRDVEVHFPKLEYCSDNAAMIGALGYYEYKERLENQLNQQGGSKAEDLTWDCFSRYQFS